MLKGKFIDINGVKLNEPFFLIVSRTGLPLKGINSSWSMAETSQADRENLVTSTEENVIKFYSDLRIDLVQGRFLDPKFLQSIIGLS